MTAMTLTLALLRHPPETRHVVRGPFGIGRGPENDWVLADPDRHLSKRHCVLSWQGAFWQVSDLSTNGTFINGEAAPIGPGQVRDLRDGDRLRLGDYEMAVRIGVPVAEPAAFALDDSVLMDPPLDFGGPVQPDHRAAVEDAFVPPRAVALIGDDWDLEVPDPPDAPHNNRAGTEDLLAAFLRGAGVAKRPPGDPVVVMEGLGAAFRALVGGLRETLIARAAVKSEFRIEQTLIRASGNNPLKFAASDDDALAALLGDGRQAGPSLAMSQAVAIGDSLRDLRLHEIATMAAMQSAVHSLMHEMAPAKLREEGGAGGLLPAQRKARAFEAYEALHARITQALADDFDSVFGRAFARAYERTLRDVAIQDKAG